MIVFPPRPDQPDGRATAKSPLRFEDISQDGRVMLEALPTGIGETIWRGVLANHPLSAEFQARGVIPVLTRMVLEGTPGPFAIDPPLSADGCYQLGHVLDARGAIERITLNVWVDLSGPEGHTYFPAQKTDTNILAGRVFAEHVFTRPFGAASERKVTSLGFGGAAEIPPTRYQPRTMDALVSLPEGAVALEPSMTLDPTPIALGLGHTDPNQHINSLVYPRLFEEAALRRLHALGRGSAFVPRALEIAYRKPSFAGETLRIAMQPYELRGKLGLVGMFVDEAEIQAEKPVKSMRGRTYVDMLLES